MFVNALTLLTLAASSLAISISGPSASAFWVQFTSNTITWSFSSGDPNPVDITVTNSNDTFLNGAFSIARNLDVSNGSFTVTNVTLKQGTGYVVNFVSPTNQTQIFASSAAFDVKPPGTAKDNSTNSSGGPNGTSTAGGPNATATAPTNGTGNNGTQSGGAMSMRLGEGGWHVVPMLAMTGIMTLVGAAITL